MIVSRKSRPTMERSLIEVSSRSSKERREVGTDLDVVALMVVATLTEKPMVNDLVYVQLVKQRIAILVRISLEAIQWIQTSSTPLRPKQ